MIHLIPCRNSCRLLHPSCIHILRWSLKHSVKWTWTGSAFATNGSAWSVVVTGSQSRVWSGPKVSTKFNKIRCKHIKSRITRNPPLLSLSRPSSDNQILPARTHFSSNFQGHACSYIYNSSHIGTRKHGYEGKYTQNRQNKCWPDFILLIRSNSIIPIFVRSRGLQCTKEHIVWTSYAKVIRV